jgi:hypothetical protein
VAGCVVVGGGFGYDVMFAGIPYQDPPPELLARYEFHASVAGYLYKAGLGMVGLGILLLVIRRLSNRFEHKAS